MTPQQLIDLGIAPALAMLPPIMDSPEARCLLVAIALQESGLKSRYQLGGGGANGFWQCERNGGVIGVLSGVWRLHAELACGLLAIDPDPSSVWDAIEYNDVLAAVIARLILWPDPPPLPLIGDQLGAYEYYVRNWRPGKPGPERWAAAYAAGATVA